MESELSAGGAAQRVVPQRARGRAADGSALMQSATLLLVSCWEALVH